MVLAIRGSWDRAAVVPPELEGGNVSRDVARIAPSEALDPSYLAYYLESPRAAAFFAGAARGVGVRGINIRDLRRMPVPMPAPSQQREAVAEIEHNLSLTDSLSAEIDTALSHSRSLRASILGSAFSGRLVAQEPSDEPASLLLERISLERGAMTKTQKDKSPHRRRKAAA